MKNIVFLSMITCLFGCAVPPKIYNPQGLAYDELAVIYSSKRHLDESRGLWAPVESRIHGITKIDGTELEGLGKVGSGDYQEAQVKPGEYRIVAYCRRANIYSKPEAIVTLEHGQKYVLMCIGDKERNALFGGGSSAYVLMIVSADEFSKSSNNEIVKGEAKK